MRSSRELVEYTCEQERGALLVACFVGALLVPQSTVIGGAPAVNAAALVTHDRDFSCIRCV
jgi:hypothetical protein